MHKVFIFGAILSFMAPHVVFGQEALAVPEESVPSAAVAEKGAAEEMPSESNDPGDVIRHYFDQMGEIVATNMDVPAALLEKFSAYIKEHEKSMRLASKQFDSKLSGMKASEAEVYRETVQRKITPSLNKLISLLIDFSSRYPVEAQQLDSMLKVDAKYTYQQ